MPERVVFYQLTRKFVSTKEDIPAESKQIIYYSLAIGHHVGVVDCFSSVLEMAYTEFAQWLSRLPEGDGRRKLEGVLKFGEIEINRSHVGELFKALEAGLPQMQPHELEWAKELMRCLRAIAEEPALYLMVKSRR